MVLSGTSRWGKDTVEVAALAGSAALVIGGQTLHSLFGMDTRPLSCEAWLRINLERPGVCKRLIRLRVLFIDELCTMPASLFRLLGYVIRALRHPTSITCHLGAVSWLVRFTSFCRCHCARFVRLLLQSHLCSQWSGRQNYAHIFTAVLHCCPRGRPSAGVSCESDGHIHGPHGLRLSHVAIVV